jgi:hypothetical protein
MKSGAYDGLGDKYKETLSKFEAGTLTDNDGNPIKTDAEKLKYIRANLLPRKSNGALFNMNSVNVLKVLAGTWDNDAGLKTENFTKNLTGESTRATIDVWAVRNLRRLMGGKRILPMSETGVTDPDFHFAQKIYDKAAEKLGVDADDLQAVMWFAEKNHWDQKGWNKSTIASEKGDLRDLLDVTSKEESSGKFRAQVPENLMTIDEKKRAKKEGVAHILVP